MSRQTSRKRISRRQSFRRLSSRSSEPGRKSDRELPPQKNDDKTLMTVETAEIGNVRENQTICLHSSLGVVRNGIFDFIVLTSSHLIFAFKYLPCVRIFEEV